MNTATRNRFAGPARGLLALFFLGSATLVYAASPDLRLVLPRGGERGVEITLTLTGERLGDASEVVFYDEGLTVLELTAVDDKKVEARVAIAPDARLGEHQLRLRTESGMSYVRTFWVGPYPSVAEVEPNNSFDEAQAVVLNSTLEGISLNEDVDFYRVEAKKGDRLSVEVEALRLGVMFDAFVAIHGPDHFVARNDDSALHRQDSVLSILAPADGTYFVEVRESAYQGNGSFRYRAHVGTFPRPTATYPAGGKAGSELAFSFLGDPGGPLEAKATLPAEAGREVREFATSGNLTAPSGNLLRVSPFENVLEVEPNDDRNSATPTDLPLPLAFNGVLGREGDQDYFKFTAKKGQKFRFRAHARSIESPVDTHIGIYHAADGKSVGGSDDADGSSDARYDFTAPADGDYVVRVRDMLLRGGADFVYRLEATAFTPKLALTMPEFANRNNQLRKAMVVHQGNRYATLVNIGRSNLAGEIDLATLDLPPGVTFSAERVPANVNSFPVVFHAAPDAPLGGNLATLAAATVDRDPAIEGIYTQKVDLVRGNPNNTIYYQSPTDRLPVSVASPAPFSIEIRPPEPSLIRSGTLPLKVIAKRQEGYDEAIVLRMLWRPPGVSCNSTATIPKGQSEVDYMLTANGSAETRPWKIAVLAEANTPTGRVYTSSDLVEVTVAPSFFTGKFDLTVAEQGSEVKLVCKLEQARPFEGNARLQLLGLPAKATAQPVEINKDATEATFTVTVAPDTPRGQHKNLYCRATLLENGVEVNQQLARGGILRVDPPSEPPPAPPSEEEKPAVAASK